VWISKKRNHRISVLEPGVIPTHRFVTQRSKNPLTIYYVYRQHTNMRESEVSVKNIAVFGDRKIHVRVSLTWEKRFAIDN